MRQDAAGSRDPLNPTRRGPRATLNQLPHSLPWNLKYEQRKGPAKSPEEPVRDRGCRILKRRGQKSTRAASRIGPNLLPGNGQYGGFHRARAPVILDQFRQIGRKGVKEKRLAVLQCVVSPQREAACAELMKERARRNEIEFFVENSSAVAVSADLVVLFGRGGCPG